MTLLILSYRYTVFGTSTPKIFLDGVRCNTTSLSALLNCSHNAIGSVSSKCLHINDVGLSCSTRSSSGGSSSSCSSAISKEVISLVNVIGFVKCVQVLKKCSSLNIICDVMVLHALLI